VSAQVPLRFYNPFWRCNRRRGHLLVGGWLSNATPLGPRGGLKDFFQGLTSAGRFLPRPPGSQIGSHKENQLVSPKLITGLKTKPK
jgi:hypothetical protein